MKMHRVVLTSMILAVTVQSQIVKEQANLQAKIDGQRYCQVDDKTASLVINFSVALKNSTGSTIVMRQPIHVVPLVSRTLADLRHSKYEFTLYAPDVFPAKPAKETHEIGGASRQTNVKPGEVFTGDAIEIALPIPLTAKFSKLDALEPGNHFVQLVLDSEIQGTGAFVRISSQPMEINVDKHPNVEKCR